MFVDFVLISINFLLISNAIAKGPKFPHSSVFVLEKQQRFIHAIAQKFEVSANFVARIENQWCPIGFQLFPVGFQLFPIEFHRTCKKIGFPQASVLILKINEFL